MTHHFLKLYKRVETCFDANYETTTTLNNLCCTVDEGSVDPQTWTTRDGAPMHCKYSLSYSAYFQQYRKSTSRVCAHREQCVHSWLHYLFAYTFSFVPSLTNIFI